MIKEDTIEGGKKSTNRKWRAWSVVLTGTQLLFFRDVNFASHLLGQPPTNGVHDSSPEQGVLNPDEIISLFDCIAVFDKSYTKVSSSYKFGTLNTIEVPVCKCLPVFHAQWKTIDHAGIGRDEPQ